MVVSTFYQTAAAALSEQGFFGKNLDRKARKLALQMGGLVLPDGWTIAAVTPASVVFLD